MLLSQNMFGPLPPSPTASISSQEVRCDDIFVPSHSVFSANSAVINNPTPHSTASVGCPSQPDSYGFPPLPPLPPSPSDHHNPAASAAYTEIGPPTIGTFGTSRTYGANKSAVRRESASAGGDRPPSIPPHRGPSINTLKTR